MTEQPTVSATMEKPFRKSCTLPKTDADSPDAHAHRQSTVLSPRSRSKWQEDCHSHLVGPQDADTISLTQCRQLGFRSTYPLEHGHHCTAECQWRTRKWCWMPSCEHNVGRVENSASVGGVKGALIGKERLLKRSRFMISHPRIRAEAQIKSCPAWRFF
jgi:hypothetical protein